MILTIENLKDISKIEVKQHSKIYFDKNFLYYYNKSNILNKLDLKNDNLLKFSTSYLFINYLKKFQDTNIFFNKKDYTDTILLSFDKYKTKSIIKLLEYDLIISEDNLLYSFTLPSEILLKNKNEFINFNYKKDSFNKFEIKHNKLFYTTTDGYKLANLSNIDINSDININDEIFYIIQKDLETIFKKIDKKNKKDILFEIYEDKIVINNITIKKERYVAYPNLQSVLNIKHNDSIKFTNIDLFIEKLELLKVSNKDKIKALDLSINLHEINLSTKSIDLYDREIILSDNIECDSMIIENKVQYNLEFFLTFIKTMKNNNIDTIYYKNNRSIIYSSNNDIHLALMPIIL